MSVLSQLTSIIGAYFAAAPDPNSLYNGQASLVKAITNAIGANTAVTPEVQRFMLTNARFGLSMPQEQLVATLAMVYQAPAESTADLANTASKLATARNISLAGAVTADPVSFDGTKDVSVNVKSVDTSALSDPIPATSLPAATCSSPGTVKQMPAMTDVVVAPTTLNWNQLMANLRNAGLMSK